MASSRPTLRAVCRRRGHVEFGDSVRLGTVDKPRPDFVEGVTSTGRVTMSCAAARD